MQININYIYYSVYIMNIKSYTSSNKYCIVCTVIHYYQKINVGLFSKVTIQLCAIEMAKINRVNGNSRDIIMQIHHKCHAITSEMIL